MSELSVLTITLCTRVVNEQRSFVNTRVIRLEMMGQSETAAAARGAGHRVPTGVLPKATLSLPIDLLPCIVWSPGAR